MLIPRPLRFIRRVLTVVLAVGVAYLGLVLVQVVQASRRDERPPRSNPADAIVVLGAAQYNGQPSPVLRARLDHAAALYRQGIAPTIVVTGGRLPGDPSETTEASASADYLARTKHISQDDILRENDGRSSWQSLASAANFLKHDGKTRVVLVSDPFHNARIDAMALELGLDAYVSPTQTSPITGLSEARHLGRETLAVAAGRVTGFRWLMGIDRVRQSVQSMASG